MVDYIPELVARPIMAERQRDAEAISRPALAVDRPKSLRAGFAAQLARVALALHREAAVAVVSDEFQLLEEGKVG